MVTCGYPAEFRESASWVPRICELPEGHGGNHFTPPQEPTPFAELLRAARASRKVETAEAEANLRPAEITVPGHEVDIASTSARTGVGQISRLAQAHGWETKVGRSEAFSGDHLQKNGIVKPGRNESFEWVEAVKTPHHFTYSLTDIRLDGRVVTKDELKEAIMTKEVTITVTPRLTGEGFKFRVTEDGGEFAMGTAPTYREAYLEAINYARSIAEDA